jgi:hypothetical protein
MKKRNMEWMRVFLTGICLSFISLCNVMAAGTEGDWKIGMTYSGGYSPIKEVRIEILKTGEQISFSAEKIYYDSTPSEKKEGAVSPETFNDLVSQLEKNDGWALPDLSEYVATDGFTYRIDIRNDDKQHAFQVYFPELQKDKRYANIANAISSIAGDL